MRKGWEILKFEDCLQKIRNTKKIPRKSFLPKGIYPVISQEKELINGYWNTSEDIFQVEKPIIIFGDHTKIVKYVNFDFVKGADGIVILLPIEKINSRFFAYQIESIDLDDLGYARHYRLLKKEEIVVPPLPEQKQIVAILDKAFAAIDQAKANIEKNIENAKELIESHLQKTFNDNLSGSVFKSLNDICELIVDCEHKTAPTQDAGYPSIRTPNIGFGELLLDGVNRVSKETYKEWTRRAIPKSGDLILAREAPAGNIGVIPENVEVCLGQRTVLIRPQEDKFIPKYLAYLILSKDVQKRLLSHSQGVTVGHINMKDIRSFKIFNLPSLEQQNIIVDNISSLLDKMNRMNSNYSRELDNVEELKKSILQKAFAGELTEKQVVDLV
ncbi:type I restriction enzyme, S subunit [Spirosomataceae bacterium TFI 002]|nr:type I restriction enzyme, S subunit [Spirosomataceae bacterium TFI 002]